MYLLDANIFIESQNRHYNINFCPAFWDFLDQEFEKGTLASITEVYDEVAKRDDKLKNWLKDRKKYFLPTDDPLTQKNMVNVATYIDTHYRRIVPKKDNSHNITHCLSGADPFLIAKALSINATVITHESLVGDNNSKPKIPNICQNFNVQYKNSFDLLLEFNPQFILERS